MAVAILYALFFLSGAAALVYQVVWVRSLTFVFGGSHLAVTAVLSIFMGGLAAGSYIVGRRIDRVEKPLRVYGFLELGIAPAALLFAILMKVYPSIYAALAQGRDDATVYLTFIRIVFSVFALILPTMLMGGTLPVVSRFVAGQPSNLRRHLSFLYSINTLGAVCGALVAGFVLIRFFSVSTTLYVAVATNVAIGLISLWLQGKVGTTTDTARFSPEVGPGSEDPGLHPPDPRLARLVLWGIGISGFCALGYEVLWTRILTMAVGASVYSFTIMLAAFLTGIALGSEAYGLLVRLLKRTLPSPVRVVGWFGVTQVLIGITALLVTVFLRNIPVNAIQLQNYFSDWGMTSFQARTWANFSLAFLYMVVPALFMGAAFPLAAEVLARHRQATGRGVGDALAANTVGSIFGAAISGLVLLHTFGIEKSLQILCVINLGLGLLVLAGLGNRRWPARAAAAATVAAITLLAVNPNVARMWDRKYFAIFRSNQPDAFSTPEKVKEAVENTDVLYYAEGTDAIVSVIRVKGGEQAFVTNGRVEASSHLQAQQVQFTLGHLPMLLNRKPKEVLVVGMGSGMTTGAASVHPTVEHVTLVEIEPSVVGVARTFEEYNHRVLDNPKVEVVFNDGRNFLTTTNRMFDVITADPIHPWFRGAGSLYSAEYFALAAKHLRPGGVIAQWLPIYELTPADLASVVKTFQQHFPHAMLFLTHYDAVIVGSNAPFQIDETELDRRILEPAIAGDLKKVNMGSAADLLSYFVMGTEGMKRFGQNGVLNTDDRPYLEYSAPFSIATTEVMSANVDAIAQHRENILPFIAPAADPAAREAQESRWTLQMASARAGDRALSLFLGRGPADPDFTLALRQLNLEHPEYAPGRALWQEYETAKALEPRLLQQESFHLVGDKGPTFVQVAAVLVPVSKTRASIMFVDNRTRTVFGQAYMNDYDRDERAKQFAADVMTTVRTTYEKLATAAKDQGTGLPAGPSTLESITAIISSKVKSVQ